MFRFKRQSVAAVMLLAMMGGAFIAPASGSTETGAQEERLALRTYSAIQHTWNTAFGPVLGRMHAGKRLCFTQPPDYPGCSQDEVRAIANNNRSDWHKNRRYGQNNILAKLTAGQKDRVKDAMKTEVRQNLLQSRDSAVATGKVDSAAAWTTDWRGDTFTVNSFPYKRYVDTWTSGTDNYQACLTNNGVYGEFFAYNWCNTQAQYGWGFWSDFADTADNPGTQFNLVCGKEIVVGAAAGGAGGAVTGAIASIWTGPGAAAGALIGGVSGGAGGATAGLVTCAGDKLWDKVF